MRPGHAAYSTGKMWRQERPCSLGAAQAAYEEQAAVHAATAAARSSSTIEKLGTGGHLAPRICAAPAAPSQKTRQPLGLAIWASRCPQPRRALRVSAAREQCLGNDDLLSKSPAGRPETRAAAKSCGKHHLLLPSGRQGPSRQPRARTRLQGPSGAAQRNGEHAWRAADGANRAKAAAHRGAAAEPTSPGAASLSATQLMPASGPPASASRFPARIRPSPAKGDAGTDLRPRKAPIRGGSAAAVAEGV
jgi:hypothetical protein